MRRKALLAEASSSFEGPWVYLEEGTWEISFSDRGVGLGGEDNKTLVEIEIDGKRVALNGRPIEVYGPVKVRGIVVSGDEIHLDAIQVAMSSTRPRAPLVDK